MTSMELLPLQGDQLMPRFENDLKMTSKTTSLACLIGNEVDETFDMSFSIKESSSFKEEEATVVARHHHHQTTVVMMTEEAIEAKPHLHATKKKATFNVTRTQTSSPMKSIKKQQEMMKKGTDNEAFMKEFKNDYRESIIENKNDYWRRMCWCEIQKKRKSRSTVVSIELRSRFERYDRWERKDFRTIDWKTFYDEMRCAKSSKPDEWLGDPRFLGAIFVIMFAVFYVLVANL